MKRCLTSSVIGGNVNKTTNEIYTRRLAKIKILTIPKVDKGCGGTGTLIHCLWECIWYSHLGKQLSRFLNS